jgi:hypothetical protein
VFVAVCSSSVFIISLGLIGGCTAALLHIRGAAPFLVAAGVCAAAASVAGTTVLSILSVWTRGAMLSLLVITAATASVGWFVTGRPRPPRLPSVRGLRKLNGPTQIILGLAVVTLVVQACVGARVAPSNWDSMTYHLSRAAYWLQYQSIGQFPGASIRQAASAPNGEVLQGLTMMMSGTDRWVQSVQWLALVGVALAVFSGARLLDFDRGESVFAACLFVVLPQPLMQSTTTQNDLIEAFFVASTAFFAVRSLRDRTRGDMTIAALAFALAVGTKGTAFIAATALAVLVVAALLAYRPPVRFVLVSAMGAVVALFALGSYNYVLNVEHRGSVLGELRSATAVTGARLPNAVLSIGTFADSAGVNVDLLNRLTQTSTRTEAARVVPPVAASTLDTSIQEDTSAFGLVGFLLLPYVLLIVLLGRRQAWSRRVLSAAVVLYVAVFAVSVVFNPWLGRLLIPAVALAAPLFAVLGKRPAMAGAALTLAVLSMMPPLLENQQKPLLLNASNVFHLDRRAQMTIIRPEMRGVLDALDTHVNKNAAIAFVGGEDSWDYPFFGAHRERRIVRHDSPAAITYALLRREHVAGAVFANVGAPPSSLAAVSLGPDYWWVAATP